MSRLAAPRAVPRRRVAKAAGIVVVVGLLTAGCAGTGHEAGRSGAPDPASRDAVLLDTLEQMGRTSEANHRYAQAVEQFGKLVEAEPDNPTYVLGLARNLRYAGQPQEAVRILRRAVTREEVTETVDVRLELARALMAAGATEDTRAQMRALEAEVPNDPRVQALLGILADRDGRHREAQAAYRAALAGDPEDLRSANNLALSLALSGDLTDAIALQTRTAQQPDATLQMRQNLALLYALAGRMDVAEQVTRAILPTDQADRVVADLGRLAGRPAAEAVEGGVARP